MDLRTDRTLVSTAGESRRTLVVRFQAPEGGAASRRDPVNLALVLDRSGSMGGGKFDLVRAAANRALHMLDGDDRFAVVVFDQEVEVLVESVAAGGESVSRAESLLARTRPRGTTDLFTGWMRGCEQVAAGGEGGIGKCLLLTDGKANAGVTDCDEIAHHAGRLRELNVRTSTFGVGAGFDERLLDRMANAGGGNFYFIESAADIPGVVANELGETLDVVARDVRLELDVDPGVRLESLGEFPQVTATSWRIGDLVARQQLCAIFELVFPAGSLGEETKIAARLVRGDGAPLDGAEGQLRWRCAAPAECDAQKRDLDVARTAAETRAARARREAIEANRAGDFEKARSILQQAADRIRSDADGDRALLSIAERLERDQSAYRRRMDPVAMKREHYRSSNLLKGRDDRGRARREPPAEDWLPLDTDSGHPIALIDGVHALIDTGSPITFGRPLPRLGFGDAGQGSLGPIGAGEISRLVGTRVDTLLGTDVLARHSFVVDWRGGRIRFSRDPSGLRGHVVDAPLRLGVPCVELSVGSKVGRAFLDTGAQLSYLDPSTVNGTPPDGERSDFFPVIGGFRTNVYRKSAAVAGIAFRLDFGVLPEALGMILGLSGIAWIAGNELLREHLVAFDLAQGTVTFAEM